MSKRFSWGTRISNWFASFTYIQDVDVLTWVLLQWHRAAVVDKECRDKQRARFQTSVAVQQAAFSLMQLRRRAALQPIFSSWRRETACSLSQHRVLSISLPATKQLELWNKLQEVFLKWALSIREQQVGLTQRNFQAVDLQSEETTETQHKQILPGCGDIGAADAMLCQMCRQKRSRENIVASAAASAEADVDANDTVNFDLYAKDARAPEEAKEAQLKKETRAWLILLAVLRSWRHATLQFICKRRRCSALHQLTEKSLDFKCAGQVIVFFMAWRCRAHLRLSACRAGSFSSLLTDRTFGYSMASEILNAWRSLSLKECSIMLRWESMVILLHVRQYSMKLQEVLSGVVASSSAQLPNTSISTETNVRYVQHQAETALKHASATLSHLQRQQQSWARLQPVVSSWRWQTTHHRLQRTHVFLNLRAVGRRSSGLDLQEFALLLWKHAVAVILCLRQNRMSTLRCATVLLTQTPDSQVVAAFTSWRWRASCKRSSRHASAHVLPRINETQWLTLFLSVFVVWHRHMSRHQSCISCWQILACRLLAQHGIQAVRDSFGEHVGNPRSRSTCSATSRRNVAEQAHSQALGAFTAGSAISPQLRRCAILQPVVSAWWRQVKCLHHKRLSHDVTTAWLMQQSAQMLLGCSLSSWRLAAIASREKREKLEAGVETCLIGRSSAQFAMIFTAWRWKVRLASSRYQAWDLACEQGNQVLRDAYVSTILGVWRNRAFYSCRAAFCWKHFSCLLLAELESKTLHETLIGQTAIACHMTEHAQHQAKAAVKQASAALLPLHRFLLLQPLVALWSREAGGRRIKRQTLNSILPQVGRQGSQVMLPHAILCAWYKAMLRSCGFLLRWKALTVHMFDRITQMLLHETLVAQTVRLRSRVMHNILAQCVDAEEAQQQAKIAADNAVGNPRSRSTCSATSRRNVAEQAHSQALGAFTAGSAISPQLRRCAILQPVVSAWWRQVKCLHHKRLSHDVTTAWLMQQSAQMLLGCSLSSWRLAAIASREKREKLEAGVETCLIGRSSAQFAMIFTAWRWKVRLASSRYQAWDLACEQGNQVLRDAYVSTILGVWRNRAFYSCRAAFCWKHFSCLLLAELESKTLHETLIGQTAIACHMTEHAQHQAKAAVKQASAALLPLHRFLLLQPLVALWSREAGGRRIKRQTLNSILPQVGRQGSQVMLPHAILCAWYKAMLRSCGFLLRWKALTVHMFDRITQMLLHETLVAQTVRLRSRVMHNILAQCVDAEEAQQQAKIAADNAAVTLLHLRHCMLLQPLMSAWRQQAYFLGRRKLEAARTSAASIFLQRPLVKVALACLLRSWKLASVASRETHRTNLAIVQTRVAEKAATHSAIMFILWRLTVRFANLHRHARASAFGQGSLAVQHASASMIVGMWRRQVLRSCWLRSCWQSFSCTLLSHLEVQMHNGILIGQATMLYSQTLHGLATCHAVTEQTQHQAEAAVQQASAAVLRLDRFSLLQPLMSLWWREASGRRIKRQSLDHILPQVRKQHLMAMLPAVVELWKAAFATSRDLCRRKRSVLQAAGMLLACSSRVHTAAVVAAWRQQVRHGSFQHGAWASASLRAAKAITDSIVFNLFSFWVREASRSVCLACCWNAVVRHLLDRGPTEVRCKALVARALELRSHAIDGKSSAQRAQATETLQRGKHRVGAAKIMQLRRCLLLQAVVSVWRLESRCRQQKSQSAFCSLTTLWEPTRDMRKLCECFGAWRQSTVAAQRHVFVHIVHRMRRSRGAFNSLARLRKQDKSKVAFWLAWRSLCVRAASVRKLKVFTSFRTAWSEEYWHLQHAALVVWRAAVLAGAYAADLRLLQHRLSSAVSRANRLTSQNKLVKCGALVHLILLSWRILVLHANLDETRTLQPSGSNKKNTAWESEQQGQWQSDSFEVTINEFVNSIDIAHPRQRATQTRGAPREATGREQDQFAHASSTVAWLGLVLRSWCRVCLQVRCEEDARLLEDERKLVLRELAKLKEDGRNHAVSMMQVMAISQGAAALT
eukprot:TRINITY_DN4467_c0_g1_i2.p1 TRINITY_DN4467_c0_g1~~TRINITY_DN4467_c0_g1_i2.p1  ORF type:complete len:2330 (-),score=297.03 TRINITY_DN4467_c0_g1_i2:63-6089(-)